MTRTTYALVALVALVLLAAGCGDDDAQPTEAGDTTTTSPVGAPGPGGPGADGTVAPPDTPVEGECSGADIVTIAAMPHGVPEAVATTLVAIRSGAQRCDYEGLAELALEDGRFIAGFGDEPADAEALASRWREREEVGEPLTANLIHLTLMEGAEVTATAPDGAEEVLHLFPRAAADDDPEARAEVLEAFGAPAGAWFTDEGYLGWRIAVSDDGDWRCFVLGD